MKKNFAGTLDQRIADEHEDIADEIFKFNLADLPDVGVTLTKRPDGSLAYKRFVLTQTELIFPDGLTEDEWADVGRFILRVRGALSWWIGDWLAEGDNRQWGETYQKIADEFGYEVETLWSYASVCRKVDSLIRNQGLYFGHHRAVMGKPQDEQIHWLGLALGNNWTVTQLKIAMSGGDPNAPTLSASNEPMDRFERKAIPFQKVVASVLRQAGEGSRQQIADWFHEIGRQIERGDLG